MSAGIDDEILREPDRWELREAAAYRFTPDRRQFLGLLGAGMWIVAREEAAGQTGATRGALEGRIHLGVDGKITVLTGKVEEGQGAKTEVAMAAAEELRAPLTQIAVLMADTDQTPNDGITAGSRTTPSTVPLVRKAAAAAQELLRRRAAEMWQARGEEIDVQQGAAVLKGGSRKLSYAELAAASKWIEANSRGLAAGVTLTPAREWKVLGKEQPRIDAKQLVTGAHRFPSDIKRPGMQYGAVLRPPSYGAKLMGADWEEAKKGQGVTLVRENEFVGCVAATSYQARRAVEALAATAQWEERPSPVSNVTLFAHLKQQAQAASRSAGTARGSVSEALKSAAAKLQATFTTAYIQHAPMEPRAAVAEWQEGRLTVWTGTSNPFAVREQLAQAFGIPAGHVRVIVPDFGGGFGGKHTGEAALEAARLARGAGRPVSLRWSRSEEFTFAYFRPAALIEIEAGLNESKEPVAWDFVNYHAGAAGLEAPYRIPHYRTRFLPSDSPLRTGSYRTLAATANNFARECAIDELAAMGGADPLEFRLAHLNDERIRAVLIAAAEKFRWRERRARREANRGVGVACGTEKNSVVAACVEVELNPQTREPRLVEICQAFECGPILNRQNLLSQVEGCILMGLGAALREEILFAGGRIRNGRFGAYRVPRFRDMPKMEIVLVDNKDREPAGAGETPIIAVAPAMANALFTITGTRWRTLPLRAPAQT